MVVFRSDSVLHRVLPCTCEQRLCFTVWLDGAPQTVNADGDVFLRAKHLSAGTGEGEDAGGSVLATIKSTPLQRSVSRWVYHAEYEASLRQCFDPPPSPSPPSSSPARQSAAATASVVEAAAISAKASLAEREGDFQERDLAEARHRASALGLHVMLKSHEAHMRQVSQG